MNDKIYILFAGVNGAGKSSLYHNGFLKDFFWNFGNVNDLHRINSDEILKTFGDWRNSKDAVKAAKIAVEQINDCLEQGISFCQETTLCGKSIIRNIKTAKDKGYKIGVIYVGLESVEIAKQRVAKRVEKGGHGIPEKDIERRYINSFENLNKIIPFCDEIAFFDNSTTPLWVAEYEPGKLQKLVAMFPGWFEKYVYKTFKEQEVIISTIPINNSAKNSKNISDDGPEF